MAFAGPITFLVFALLSIYTTLIIMSNALGVTVSAAHRIAGNIFAVAVLCGDPLIKPGRRSCRGTSCPRCPNASPRGRWRVCCRGSGCSPGSALPPRARSCASSAAGHLLPRRRRGRGSAFAIGGGARDGAAVVTNIVSKSMYGVTVAAKQLGFLAAITGVGLVGFAGSLWWFKHNLVGSELYYWMWWVVAGYYGLAIADHQVRSSGVPGIVKGSFHDDRKDTPAPATA